MTRSKWESLTPEEQHEFFIYTRGCLLNLANHLDYVLENMTRGMVDQAEYAEMLGVLAEHQLFMQCKAQIEVARGTLGPMLEESRNIAENGPSAFAIHRPGSWNEPNDAEVSTDESPGRHSG